MNKRHRENYCPPRYDACGVVWCGVCSDVSEEPVASFVGYTTLLLETAFYCETSLCTYQDVCQHFSVDSRLLSYCCEKLKSHTNTFLAETSYLTEELISSCVACSSFFYPFLRPCLRISGEISVILI